MLGSEEKKSSKEAKPFCTHIRSFISVFSVSMRHVFARIRHIHSVIRRSSSRGAILIILACFIPVVLLGIKYSRVLFEAKEEALKEAEDPTLFKRCAREAALAVARNWNPGLTLGQQRAGVYKVADAVYNAYPCLRQGPIGNAIPGTTIPSTPSVRKGEFSAAIDLSPSKKTVKYSTNSTYKVEGYSYATGSNPYYCMWLGIDKFTDNPSYRKSIFDELDKDKLSNADYCLVQHELYAEPFVRYCESSSPTDAYFYNSDSSYAYIYYNSLSSSSSNLGEYQFDQVIGSAGSEYKVNNNTYVSSGIATHTSGEVYTERSTGPDAEYVQISIASDSEHGGKIQVKTDDQIAYAVPAQCNVDIVLAVPVNGAASNENNRDLASDTPEEPLSYSNKSTFYDSIRNTPIYQMGQACKNFVKDNFYHVRGVTMGLIPYSGKLSISPDRATDWTVSFPQFVDTSTNTQLMIGSCLYGTHGQKGQPLKRSTIITTIKTDVSITAPYYWGGLQHGCPIMFRRGTAIGSYGGNSYYGGYSEYLLNMTDPSTDDNYKYLRMDLNPCTVGYANQLSMKCEKACTYFSANPYYVIEPTADLVKIYEMCNALMPFYDPNNVSNFIFLPFEWANNFWQSWTRTPSASVFTGSGDSAVLKREAKTSDRKKALILLVNKPDWFEPGELTYLGFDNDASEIPMTESDKIDFSINYSDTSKLYLDGTAYDGTIQGQKKILKYTQTSGSISYDSTKKSYKFPNSGTGRLTFPKKGTVKIVAKVKISKEPELDNFENINSNLNSINSDYWRCHALVYGNGKFIAMNANGDLAYSSNCVNWTKSSFTLPYNSRSTDSTGGVEFGNGVFVAMSSDGHIAYSSDGMNWTGLGQVLSGSYWYNLHYDGSKFIAADEDNHFAFSNTGTSWPSESFTDSQFGYNWRGGIMYANGKYVFLHRNGDMATSTDAKNWTKKGHLSGVFIGGTCSAKGYFIALQTSGTYYHSKDGENWTEGTTNLSSIQSSGWYSICYVNGKMYALNASGNIAVCESPFGSDTEGGTISFSNTSMFPGSHNITEKSTFSIKDSEISDTQDSDGNYYIDINTNSVELISAEITNVMINDNPVNATYNDTDYGAGSGYGGASIETLSEDSENGIKTIRIKSKKSGTATLYLEKYTKTQGGNGTITWETKSCNLSSVLGGDLQNYSQMWRGLVDGNSDQFLAINSSGKLAKSSDGINWTKLSVTLSGDSFWGAPVYGNGTWVCISSSGQILTSSNGINWTNQTSISGSFDTVRFANGIFMCISSSGAVYTSSNGINWNNVGSTGVSIHTYILGYYNGKWLGGGHSDSSSYISINNGSSWSLISHNRDSIQSNYYMGGVNVNGYFYVAAYNSGKITRSTDGVTWEIVADLGSSTRCDNITYFNNKLYVNGADGSQVHIGTFSGSTIQPYYKIGSSSQTNVNSNTTISVSLSSTDSSGNYYADVELCCLNVTSCVISYSETVDASYNNLSFTTLSDDVINGVQTVRLKSKKSGTAALYVEKQTKTNPLSASWDFSKWTGGSFSSASSECFLFDASYDGSKFFAINGSGSIFSSEDGVTWTSSGSLSSISSEYWRGIVCGSGNHVAINFGSSSVATSTTGTSWSSQGTLLNGMWSDNWYGGGTYDGSRFVVLTASTTGKIATSSDGMNWTQYTTNLQSIASGNWDGIAYGNNKYVAVSRNKNVAVSFDAISWTSQGAFSSSGSTVCAFCYGDGHFLTLSKDGDISSSSDGINWVSHSRPLDSIGSGWRGVCYGNHRFVAIGSGVSAYCIPTLGTIHPYYKIGSSSQVNVNSNTTISVSLSSTDSDGYYYADVTLCCLNVKSNAFTYSDTKAVDDLIPFYNNNTTSQNSSPRTLTYSGTSGSHLGGNLYSCTGTGTISLANCGKLKLKIMPNLTTQSGTFAFTTGSDTSSQTIAGTVEYTIEVEQQQVNGSQWQVSFSMTNIVLITAEFVLESNRLNITLPNSSRSAYIDFSQTSSSQPYHSNSSYFIFGSDVSGSVPSGTTYDSELKRWCTTSGVNKFYDKILKYKGLMWLITEDLEDSASVKNLYYSTNTSSSSTNQLSTYLPGLVRTTYTADQVWNYLGFETTDSRKTVLTAAGITFPYNVALCAKYGQKDSNAGLKQLMKDACSKLQSDHGTDNTRVYIIKFREQATHAERARNGEGMSMSSVSNDYSYFSACTSYVYSATESNLKDRLDTIADDIKSWAEYQDAKNVD